MKQQLHGIIKLTTIFILTILISCNKEDITATDADAHSHVPGPHEISLKDFKRISGITNVDAFLKQKTSGDKKQSRNSGFSLPGFSIDTTFINQYVLNNGKLSFPLGFIL